MREGPEHSKGWRAHTTVDGQRIDVEARHHPVRRMPHGHELSRQIMSGRPMAMVETLSHEWAVIHNRRFIATLRQTPSGNFSYGHHLFQRQDLLEAAASAYRLLHPAPKPAIEDTAEPERSGPAP